MAALSSTPGGRSLMANVAQTQRRRLNWRKYLLRRLVLALLWLLPMLAGGLIDGWK